MTNQSGFKPSVAPSSGGMNIKHAKGRLQSWEADVQERTGADGGKYTTTTIKFNLGGDGSLQVLEAESPHPWPTWTMALMYVDPQRSFNDKHRWGAWSNSMRKILGEAADLDMLNGKVLEIQALPWELRVPDPDKPGVRNAYVNASDECYQLVSVDGAVGASQGGSNGTAVGSTANDLLNKLAGIADGKNDADFYSAALQLPEITANANMISAITNRQLIDTMVVSKVIERTPEGLLKAVAAGPF